MYANICLARKRKCEADRSSVKRKLYGAFDSRDDYVGWATYYTYNKQTNRKVERCKKWADTQKLFEWKKKRYWCGESPTQKAHSWNTIYEKAHLFYSNAFLTPVVCLFYYFARNITQLLHYNIPCVLLMITFSFFWNKEKREHLAPACAERH